MRKSPLKANTLPSTRPSPSGPRNTPRSSTTRQVFVLVHAALTYSVVPLLLVGSLVMHVHFRQELTQLMNFPNPLHQTRALLWFAASIVFFLRSIATPRGQTPSRLALLILASCCSFFCFEELRWGELLPGFGFLAQEGRHVVSGFSVFESLHKSTGFPIHVIAALIFALYGCLLPFLVVPKVNIDRSRFFILQAIPTPRLALWFLVSCALYTGYLTAVGEQIGQIGMASCFLLVALAPSESRLRFAAPDSASVVLFLVGTACFAAIVFEPHQRRIEEERLYNLQAEMLDHILSNNIEALADILQGADGHYALNSVPLVAEATSVANKDLVTALLSRGASPNLPNARGRTALEIAAEQGLSEIGLTLLLNNANPNLSNPEGTTPVIAAINRKNVQFLNQLLKYGGDPNLPDARGRLPLIEAARVDFAMGITRLASAGANLSATSIQGESALDVAPENSRAKIALMTLLFDEEDSKSTKLPILAVKGSPSIVWESSKEGQRLAVVSVSIQNFGELEALGVSLTIEIDEENTEKLIGPETIASRGQATYFLSGSFLATKETVKLKGSCENCRAAIDALLSDL